jgi:hypothetical protein
MPIRSNGKLFIIPKLIATIFFSSVLVAQNAFTHESDVQNISSDKYFEATLTELNNAKSSIQVVMYLLSILPEQPDAQPSQLVQALIKAKERGVDVKVVLDQNINFEAEASEDAVAGNKNQRAYEILRNNNVPVFFDTSDIYTHTKALVIDGETVILGSTNWSKAALTRNNEASVLIRSKDLAQEVLQDFSKIKLQENIPASFTPAAAVSGDFLSKKLLGEMATQSDARAFDTYLYLVKEYDGNAEGNLTIDYDKIADSLGISKMSKEDYRRQINKVLEKLDTKYKLITYKSPERNQNAEVRILKLSQEDKINIPTTYWRYGWNTALKFPAKVMYLINLSYSQKSPDGRFSIAREKLSSDHHISESFISDGNQELRRLNLLDIQYGDLEDLKFSQRQANTYFVQELYDPNELKAKLKYLEQKHGKDKFNRAIHGASIVYEENNLKTIYALLELEDKYGEPIVSEAVKKISEKNPDNPKRSAGYLINTIKSMGKN